MNENKHINDRMRSTGKMRYLSTIVMVGVIFVMILYLFLTIYSTNKLAEHAEIISMHPFEVTVAVGDIKNSVSQMRIRCERLTKHNSTEDIMLVKNALDYIYETIVTPLTVIETQYLSNPKDVEEIKETLEQIKSEQDACVSFAKSASLLEIEQYEEIHIYPLYEKIDEQLETVITMAQTKKVQYGEMAWELRNFTLNGSIVLMTLIVGGLLLSQFVVRRQGRELLHRSLLFDNLSLSIDDAFLIRDVQSGEISYISLNIDRILGNSIKRLEDIYRGFEADDINEIFETIRNPNFVSPFIKEVKRTFPNGETHWISISVYRTTGMKTPQFISVFSDCTKEKQAHQALQDAMISAKQANAAKTVFLSRMSHEIRTPLNAIIGMTTIAATSVNDSAKVQHCLEKIGFSSKHLLMLINDVLDMSKIESNKISLQKDNFDLFQLISGFASYLYTQSKNKGIDFTEVVCGFDGKSQYLGDPLRLNQILMNLGSNAIKFTASGGKIRLEVKKLASKDTIDTIRFIVTDTGIGMAKESLERIFMPFEQADASITSRFGGTGLGMTITQNLVMLKGGNIEVQSELGVGTSCIVDLPFQRSDEITKQPDFANQSLRALIVDDEQSVCMEISSLLNKIKIKNEWVLTGFEAVNQVIEAQRQDNSYDFCLIDWKMPEMDGIETTRQIRTNVGANLPIIMISAYDYSEIEDEAKLAGANVFLPKPLDRSSVYDAIQSTLSAGIISSSIVHKCSSLKGKRLLLAEDNEINSEIAMELLAINDIETECAVNGREALQMFLKSPVGYYDAILMDVQMPVMDGYEATRQIRVSEHPNAKNIPIIATTANAFSDDISLALAAGMDAHVGKPIDFDQLYRILMKLLKEKNEDSMYRL